MKTKYKKIYVFDERKMAFDFLHKDNKLSVEDALKELRKPNFRCYRNMKEINVYIFIFEFDKRIKCTTYKNRTQIEIKPLGFEYNRIQYGFGYIQMEYYRKCKDDYRNYLKQIGVIKSDSR